MNPEKHHYLASLPAEIPHPGAVKSSPAKALGRLLAEEMRRDPRLYFFSPDETTSNKLDAVYEVTQRAWSALPREDWDLPESASGRIVELLSENALAAAAIGHLLANKEPSIMASYESFFEIIASQLLQHLKFLKQVEETPWRRELQAETSAESSSIKSKLLEDPANSPVFPSLNLLSTSTCWRQDHNGFSHQSPALISTLLSVPNPRVNCLFPVDDVAATAAFDFILDDYNTINLVTFNKTDEPRWIDQNHARFQLENGGASIFGFASNVGEYEAPDYIFTAAGDIVTKETLAAIRILNDDLPQLKIRFVGLAALSYGAIGTTRNHLPPQTFNAYFTEDKPIIANFHGYPETLKSILSNYASVNRLRVHGFEEQGSTTTPFEMLSLNRASRFHLALDVARDLQRDDLIAKYEQALSDNHRHAAETSEDLVT